MTTLRYYRYDAVARVWRLIGIMTGADSYMFLLAPEPADIVTYEHDWHWPPGMLEWSV
jgi:hypothetical protein